MGRLLVALTVVLALTTSAHAKSPVRFTPDGTTILVNKDVGTERWAISLDTERATVSGNVLIGAPPPENAVGGRIAFKTGTSYGFRDG